MPPDCTADFAEILPRLLPAPSQSFFLIIFIFIFFASAPSGSFSIFIFYLFYFYFCLGSFQLLVNLAPVSRRHLRSLRQKLHAEKQKGCNRAVVIEGNALYGAAQAQILKKSVALGHFLYNGL